MHVTNPNNIKIYNLSYGKSLPEFVSEKKKRSLIKSNVELQRRIELIQDFGMPTVTNVIRMSPDQQYIIAAGTYKPRIRCYDVKDLSMKFETCIDCEVVTFRILSEDYSKVVYLLRDRYVELHTPQGSLYKTRFPMFGRDMTYHPANCDLIVVGNGSEICRLNLDQGKFLKPYESSLPELTKCTINKDHHLIMVGGSNGVVECWDPRSKCQVGMLDCTRYLTTQNLSSYLAISALEFSNPLCLGVGTSTGHVLLYDIRNNRPSIVKDHHYELPIHSIAFSKTTGTVLSSDKRTVKLWEEHTGKAVTAVEMESPINDFHLVQGSGLFFLASESPKISTYFIPMLGPAPKWCSFLDNLTEELEENPVEEIYEDYKFLTAKEVESLGLSNLIGSTLLRAYMHGYFIDMRLYHKAVSIANPFAYKAYRKKKIAEKMEEEHKSRVNIKKLPSVNKKMAERLITMADMKVTNTKKKQQKKVAESLLDDDRFKAIFEDPDFEVDEDAEEYNLISQPKKSSSGSTSQSTKVSEHNWQDDSSDDEKSVAEKQLTVKGKTDGPQMYAIKLSAMKGEKPFSTMHDLEALGGEASKEKQKRKLLSLEERMEKDTDSKRKSEMASDFVGGDKEFTFVVEEKSKTKKKRVDQMAKQTQNKRNTKRRPLSKAMQIKKRKSFHH